MLPAGDVHWYVQQSHIEGKVRHHVTFCVACCCLQVMIVHQRCMDVKVCHHVTCCFACCFLQVMYVHQSRVNFKGSPHDFFQLAQSFAKTFDNL
jgi:hypothetical protein